MKPTLVVMAAGMGSRYGGLKQIDPIGPSGELVIDYSIYDAIRAGFGKVVFVIRKDIEKLFRESIGQRIEEQVHVDYVFQEITSLPSEFQSPEARTKPWGTGHATLLPRSIVQSPFAVINADDFYGTQSFQVLANFLNQSQETKIPEYALVGFLLRKTLSEFGSVSRGVCQCDDTNYLIKVEERTKISQKDGKIFDTDADGNILTLSGNEMTSMNMWGFMPSVFPLLEKHFVEFLKNRINDPKAEFYITTFITDLLSAQKAKVKILVTNEEWFGVTYPEDKPMVVQKINALIKANRYPASLWNHAPIKK
jgi:dTDP-glucose pyrophosphorylase